MTEKDIRIGVDNFEYTVFEGIIRNGDWVYHTLKDIVYKTDDASRDNSTNEEHGMLLLIVEGSSNPKLISDGVKPEMSDKVWFNNKADEERRELVAKYSKELDFDVTNYTFSAFGPDAITYYRKRETGLISDKQAARVIEIRSEATQRCKGYGFSPRFETDRYKGFIEGAEWADKNVQNYMDSTEDVIKQLWMMENKRQALDNIARELYNEKFPRSNKPNDGWHVYSHFTVISENTITIHFEYGAGDMEFTGSFDKTF